MKEMIIKITNSTGLHARPAAILVNGIKQFESKITIKKGNREVNLKSLIGLLSLGICQNEEVTFKADGSDENEAIESIKTILKDLID